VYKDSMTAAGGGASAQLTVPENLKLMPLLACALVKHVSRHICKLLPVMNKSDKHFSPPNVYRLDSEKAPRFPQISEHTLTPC
jgi:hypothetical protein